MGRDEGKRSRMTEMCALWRLARLRRSVWAASQHFLLSFTADLSLPAIIGCVTASKINANIHHARSAYALDSLLRAVGIFDDDDGVARLIYTAVTEPAVKHGPT